MRIISKKITAILLCLTMTILVGCEGAGTQSVKIDLPDKNTITEKTLKDVFAEHGMKVGCCINSGVTGSANTETLIRNEFNSVTTENAMKPDSVLSKSESQRTGEIVVEFSDETVRLLNWAKDKQMPMRGHTLVWYSQTPEWIFHQDFDESKALVGRDEMLARMESFIRQMFETLEHMGCLDLFYAYDVVNEGFMEDGTLRRSNWTETVGEDYIWYAFYYADKYAPESVDLYYNDYNEQYKGETLCEYVKTLVDEDGRSLIDGIGMQGHLFTADDLATYLEGVDKLAETGLKLEVTELDLGLGAYQAPAMQTQDKFREQGRYYYELINGLFERADAGKINMDSVTFWGFTDGASWRSEYAPQLFDSELLPKYAYYGAMQIKDYAGYDTGENAGE